MQPKPLAALRSNRHLTSCAACLSGYVHVKSRATDARGMIPDSVDTEDLPTRGPWPPLSAAAEWAGYLAVVPLALGLAGVGLCGDIAARELAQRATIAWGAALLAFGGAVHWGLALAGRLRWRPALFAAALAPLSVAAVAVLSGGQHALALLVVGFGGLWLYEHRVLGDALPPAYLALRRGLSVAICLLLALTMFLSDAVGLA